MWPFENGNSLEELKDLIAFKPVNPGKVRNNKRQLAEMKQKQIAKRRKRRLIFGRS